VNKNNIINPHSLNNALRKMEEQRKSYLSIDIHDFETILLRLMSKIGYRIELIKSYENEIEIIAKTNDPFNEIKTLIEFKRHIKDIGPGIVKKIHERAREMNISKSVLISLSDFTSSARNSAIGKQIKLIDGTEFLDLLEQYGLIKEFEKEKLHKIFEFAFTPKMTESEARKYFEDKSGKKIMGIFGSTEKVSQIEFRYAPIGSIEIKYLKNVETGAVSKITKIAEMSNTIYINLNTLELYYVTLGFLGQDSRIMSSDVFKKIINLPDQTIRILSDIATYKEISIDRITTRYPSYMGMEMNHLITLRSLGLIDEKPNRMGYVLNINIPNFEDSRYDLKKFFEIKESVDSECIPDEINYYPEDVLSIVQKFFNSRGIFKGVIYMPYYRCKYTDEEGRFRYASLLIPKKLSKKL